MRLCGSLKRRVLVHSDFLFNTRSVANFSFSLHSQVHFRPKCITRFFPWHGWFWVFRGIARNASGWMQSQMIFVWRWWVDKQQTASMAISMAACTTVERMRLCVVHMRESCGFAPSSTKFQFMKRRWKWKVIKNKPEDNCINLAYSWMVANDQSNKRAPQTHDGMSWRSYKRWT